MALNGEDNQWTKEYLERFETDIINRIETLEKVVHLLSKAVGSIDLGVTSRFLPY